MNCPRCVTALVEWDTGKGKTEGCTRCKGVYLSLAAIQAHVLRPHAFAPFLETPLIGEKESFIKCPACSGTMTLGGLIQTDLRVDRCSACHGIWFDSGEIDRMFELVAGLPATSPDSSPGLPPPGATAQLRVPSQAVRVPLPPARRAFRNYLMFLIIAAVAVGFYFKNPFR